MIPSGAKIFLAATPIDFRKGPDALLALVRDAGSDPFSGAVQGGIKEFYTKNGCGFEYRTNGAASIALFDASDSGAKLSNNKLLYSRHAAHMPILMDIKLLIAYCNGQRSHYAYNPCHATTG